MLLERGRAAGVERFVYTSTSWTVAAGSPEAPAVETAVWNLDSLRSPYSETKREAERLVLEQDQPGFGTVVLCPAMVIGPRDVRPTSTRVLLHMARTPVALLPEGGTAVVDVRVVAEAHVRRLSGPRPAGAYVLAGPYLSYAEMARLVARGWPPLANRDHPQRAGTPHDLGGGADRSPRTGPLAGSLRGGGGRRLPPPPPQRRPG